MCDKISQFNVNKYVHLKDFLHKDSCAELTAALKDLVAQKQTRKDEQCPLSEEEQARIKSEQDAIERNL